MRAPDRTISRAATLAPEVAPELRDARASEITLAFEDNGLASVVFGHYDQNIAKIERRLGVSANVNGNQIIVKGPRDACEQARRVLEMLYARAKLGQAADLGDVDGAIAETVAQESLFPSDGDGGRSLFHQIKTRRKGVVRARNAAQDRYLAALKQHELVFAEGPAGTGKTWLAVGHAVSLLEQGLVERLILSRPAVEAGERLGFLPGDMRDKVDPYLRPIYDALHDFMEGRMVERGIQTGMIEIAPLAFMRGRTLAKSVVLLDEAQNATSMQMKMFLTRLGEGSRMIVNGDPTQTDLPPGHKSGLSEAVALLSGLDGVGHVIFRHGDVVRHDLVRRIVAAYESAGRTRVRADRRDEAAHRNREVGGLAQDAGRVATGEAGDRREPRGDGDDDRRRRRGRRPVRGRRDGSRDQRPLARPRQVDQCAFVPGRAARSRLDDADARRHPARLRDGRPRGGGGIQEPRRPYGSSRHPRLSAPARLRPSGRRRGRADGGAGDDDPGAARDRRSLCRDRRCGRLRMSETERGAPAPADQGTAPAREATGGLFDRLRALFGLGAASVRDDLEDALVGANADFTPQERAILTNVLGLHDVRVADVMVPRADIIALGIDAPLSEVLSLFRTAGHSRLPVHGGTLDDPRGMVHIRDFVDYLASRPAIRPGIRRGGAQARPDAEPKLGMRLPLSRADILRPVLFTPPSMPALDLLVKMQASHTHMALVIDEYGGTDGLVSIEDVVEAIVGDIEDEHDEADAREITRTADGALIADARASLEAVSRVLGFDLSTLPDAEDVETIGGLIMAKAGRVPGRGELVDGLGEFEFEILDADPRRIKRLKIHPLAGRSRRAAARRRRAAGDPAPAPSAGSGPPAK